MGVTQAEYDSYHDRPEPDNRKKDLHSLMNMIKKGWFPLVSGDQLFDIILKRKCILLGIVSPYKIYYPEINKTVKVDYDTLFKRYINLLQLTKVEKNGQNWTSKYI